MNDTVKTDVQGVIEKLLRAIAEERDLTLPALAPRTEIVDELGFSSLMVATLMAHLEEELGVDPFQDEDVSITGIRTLQDLTDVYTASLERRR